MEQSRVLIAIALSFLVFLVWEAIFVDRKPVQNAPQTQELQEKKDDTKTETATLETEKEDGKVLKSMEENGNFSAPPVEISQTIVDTPLYSVVISGKGATFTSFVLKKYKEKVGDGAPLKQLISDEANKGSLLLSFKDNGVPGLEDAVFGSPVAGKNIVVNDKPEKIVFSWKSPEGVVFEKQFAFSPNSYLISLVTRVKNGSERTLEDRLAVSLTNYLNKDGAKYGFEGVSGLVDGSVKEIKVDDIKDERVIQGEIGWIGIETIYFMNSIVPGEKKIAAMEIDEKNETIVENSYVEPPRKIEPGSAAVYEYDVFFGPKSLKLLNEMNNGLERAIHFGIFDFIAKPCLWLMNFIYQFIPNYGVAIIVLTIIVKLLLWPLGNKSYKSMAEMKKLQPLMTEIREKYKDDKRKMNQETMALYKTYKINPMGGCLPMILQIPVFFALYRMLYEAIELRHAPFFLWINDLSAPDRLFRFDFAIPFMEPPYGIPVLTLIMGATMFLQQKMTPTAGDPMQAKLMTFMPIIFTFIFVNFSSGLVLYWLVNNVLSIGQQYYVQKKK